MDKVVKLLVRSSPGETPVHENNRVSDVNYRVRGEYLLEYDAMDDSGNRAEQVSFAMILTGRCSLLHTHSLPSCIC